MKNVTAGLALLFAAAPLHASEGAGERLVEPFAGGQVAEIVVGLFVVLFIIGVVAWLVRRVPGLSVSSDGRVKVVSGVSVGQRERILLVEIGDQQLLVGVAPGRVETLHVLEQPLAPDESGGETAFARSFHGFVERFRHQQGSTEDTSR